MLQLKGSATPPPSKPASPCAVSTSSTARYPARRPLPAAGSYTRQRDATLRVPVVISRRRWQRRHARKPLELSDGVELGGGQRHNSMFAAGERAAIEDAGAQQWPRCVRRHTQGHELTREESDGESAVRHGWGSADASAGEGKLNAGPRVAMSGKGVEGSELVSEAP
jgi:hypothetical protein